MSLNLKNKKKRAIIAQITDIVTKAINIDRAKEKSNPISATKNADKNTKADIAPITVSFDKRVRLSQTICKYLFLKTLSKK